MEGGRQVAVRMTVASLQQQHAERCALVGVVVSAIDGTPPAFVLDDTTGIILVRQFERPANAVVGTAVNVIGWCREHDGERYIASDIVKRIDVRWLDVHRRLVVSVTPATASSVAGATGVVEEKITDDDDTDIAMLRTIRELDAGSGAPVDDIVRRMGADAENRVVMMLQRGDVFEVSPGKIKVLE